MRYIVRGASLETGQECIFTIEASTPAAAVEQAQAMRIAVSSLDVEAPAIPVRVANVVTTERTSKAVKKQYLLALALMLGGLVVGLSAQASGMEHATSRFVAMVGSLALSGGLIWLIVTRVRDWWHHG